jgi:hypothetical protein
MFYGRYAEGRRGVASLKGEEGEKDEEFSRRAPRLLFPSGRAAADPLSAAPPYISAGAAIPSSARPLASVRRVATVKARRAVRVGSGEVSTGQA